MKGFGGEAQGQGGKFYSPIVALGRVDKMIIDHEQLAVLAVSTTGVKPDDEVTRACLAVYSYNEKTKMYEEKAFFDKYRQVSEPILERASSEEARAKYDVFATGGFTIEEYKERAIPHEDFKREIDKMLEAIKGNSLLIVNGNSKFSKILENSGIEVNQFRRENPNNFVYQEEITRDFFMSQGVPDFQFCNLDRLKSYLTPDTPFSFAKDSDKVEVLKAELKSEMQMEKFSDLNSEQKSKFIDYCTKNAHESGLGNSRNLSKEIKATIDDLAKQEMSLENKIIGADERVRTISTFVTWLEQNHTYEQTQGKDSYADWALQQDRADEAIRAEMSAKGKKEYAEADIDKKYEILIKNKHIKPEAILAGNSEYHKLKEAILNPDIDSVCVIHASTEPMNFQKKGTAEYYGEPMFVSAVCFSKNEDGTLNQNSGEVFEVAIKVTQNALNNIAMNQNGSKPFDAFAYAGISEVDYKNGSVAGYNGEPIVVMDTESAIKHIEDFTRERGENCQFLEFGNIVRPSLSRIGSPSIVDKDIIDLSQVVKDYSYLVSHSDEVKENVIVDENAPNFKFDLEHVAVFFGNSATTTFEKACVGIDITANLSGQIAEMEKEKHKDDVKETPEVPEKTEEAEKESSAPTEPKTEENQQKPPEIPYEAEEDEIDIDSPEQTAPAEPEADNRYEDEKPFDMEEAEANEPPYEIEKSEVYDKVEKEAEENQQMKFDFGEENSEPAKEEAKEEKKETKRPIRDRRKKPAPEPARSEVSADVAGVLAGILDMQQQMLQEMRNDKETVNQQMMLLTSKMTEMVSQQMTAISVLVETNQKAFERCDTIIEQNNALRDENKSLKERIEALESTMKQNKSNIAELSGRVDILADIQEYRLENAEQEKEQPNVNR